jgi:hypothetical protein
MATTVVVATVKKGAAPEFAGNYVILDGNSELSVMPSAGVTEVGPVPDRFIGRISFAAHAGTADMPFVAAYSEESVVIEPQNEAAMQLARARPEYVLGLTMVELQKQVGFVVGNVKTVYFDTSDTR